MKKIVLCIAIIASLFFSPLLKSQELGVSASALVFMPKYKDVVLYNNGNVRTLGHTGNIGSGIRLEGNYILPGYSIPVSGFNGLGFSYFFPVIDSCAFSPNLKNGSRVDVIGTGKTSHVLINFRCGYEIPQDFNEFLLLHFGWGMGFMHSKTQYILPEKSAQFHYDTSDFDPATLIGSKVGYAEVEVLVGGVYELEHFSLMADYSVIFGMTSYTERPVIFHHGLTVGIFYPLKKL